MLAEYMQLHDAFPPSVRHYWQRLQQRAGYQRACAAEQAAAQAQGVSLIPAPLTAP